MGVLIVDRKGIMLAVREDRIELRHDGELAQSVPAALVERVILRANVHLEAAALADLAERGIGIVATAGRTGSRVAHVIGASARDARTRLAQAHVCFDENAASDWCRAIVRSRLRGQRRLVERIRQERPDLRKRAMDSLGTLDRVLAAVEEPADRASLRGFEGAGAAAFFRAYTRAFAPALKFEQRRRRPPPDPVNASLSLGYTLLVAEAVDACWASGLDPAIGFLHMPAHARPSLACDLAESWRVKVEEHVRELFRTGELRAAHFGEDGGGGCLLGKAGRERFYRAWSPLRARLKAALRRHGRVVATGLLRHADASDAFSAFESDVWK